MEQKKQGVVKALTEYAGKYKILTYFSWALAGISAVLALCPFYFIWRVIQGVLDSTAQGVNAQALKTFGWCAVGSAFASYVVYVAALLCSHLGAFRIKANMTIHVMRHVMTLPLGLVEKHGSGKLRKIISDSTAASETFLAHSLPDKAVSYVTPVCLILMMLFFNWKIGLLCLVPAVIAFVSMGSMMGESMKRAMSEYQNSLETMSNEAVEYVRGIPVVKTFAQTVFSFNRFKTAIDGYEKWTIAYTKSMRLPMIGFVTASNAVFAFIIFAAFLLGRGGVNSSLILDILFYIILTPLLTLTLMKVAYAGESQMVVQDAMNRINWILSLNPLEEPAAPKQPDDFSIEFENVTFSYDESKQNAIDGISLKIQSGRHVAFVGQSGSGKTTLASLVARFFDVKGGSIKIGGTNIKEIPSDRLMNSVSYVFQDSKLLKTSILENIRLGSPGATEGQVIDALEKAQCADIIQKLPQGIHTVIGSKGVYVSGGEAERLSIARAFLKDSKILILDEATAFADPDNEAKVQKAFENLSKDKTVIMIAHRLSTVTNADEIFVMDGGRICEQGTHAELVQKNGLYAHMWREYNTASEWRVN